MEGEELIIRIEDVNNYICMEFQIKIVKHKKANVLKGYEDKFKHDRDYQTAHSKER